MVLNRYRARVDSILMPAARAFERIGPDALSVISLVCAFVAAALLVIWREPVVLLVAFLLILLNGFFDALDGRLARLMNRLSRRGDLLDHVIDRYADFLIIGGIALSAFANTGIGLLALGSVMIVSYMGAQSQALGMGRDYGGLLGRAERILLLMLFMILQYLLSTLFVGSFELLPGIALTLLDLLLVFFIIAANITVLQRFLRAWRALS